MYEQGDILLIPVPFSDLTTTKRRPVMVLSNTRYNKSNEDFMAAAVTSNLRQRPYAVLIDNAHMETGALPKPSCVRADKLYTLANSIVIKRIGHLKLAQIEQIKDQVQMLLKD